MKLKTFRVANANRPNRSKDILASSAEVALARFCCCGFLMKPSRLPAFRLLSTGEWEHVRSGLRYIVRKEADHGDSEENLF